MTNQTPRDFGEEFALDELYASTLGCERCRNSHLIYHNFVEKIRLAYLCRMFPAVIWVEPEDYCMFWEERPWEDRPNDEAFR